MKLVHVRGYSRGYRSFVPRFGLNYGFQRRGSGGVREVEDGVGVGGQELQ